MVSLSLGPNDLCPRCKMDHLKLAQRCARCHRQSLVGSLLQPTLSSPRKRTSNTQDVRRKNRKGPPRRIPEISRLPGNVSLTVQQCNSASLPVIKPNLSHPSPPAAHAMLGQLFPPAVTPDTSACGCPGDQDSNRHLRYRTVFPLVVRLCNCRATRPL